MKKSVIILIVFASMAGIICFFVGTVHPKDDRSVKVAPGIPLTVMRAIDGDTIEFGNGERLRYIGIDTPEEVDPRKPVQCWAVEAAEANKKLVEGKTVVFTQDVSAHDKYGRWLGFVRVIGDDGSEQDVNAELVRQGHAFSYRFAPDTSRSKEFDAAEAEARKLRKGLWSHCQVTKGKGRKQTNALP